MRLQHFQIIGFPTTPGGGEFQQHSDCKMSKKVPIPIEIHGRPLTYSSLRLDELGNVEKNKKNTQFSMLNTQEKQLSSEMLV